MISIGNFFYKYRNVLFIVLYLLLFIPSPMLFNERIFGERFYLFPIIIGLAVTVTGQLIRGATIGLVYIIRGGKDGKVYADDLVTRGIFNHCRNPLYVGNILMLLGVGILANSLIYVAIVIPFFLLIYQAIVLAEENFLRGKFREQYDDYARRVNRWIPNFEGISKTFADMRFNWKRWLLKEYNTQFVWLSGIMLILLLTYPQLTNYDEYERNVWIVAGVIAIAGYYFTIRYLKKSGTWRND